MNSNKAIDVMNPPRLLSYVLAREMTAEEIAQVVGALQKAETTVGDTGDSCTNPSQS